MELDGISLFAGLDDAALAELAGKAVRRRFAAGQVLCREGEPCATVFVIISGLAQVRTGGVEVNLMRHGDVAGELGIFGGQPRTATVEAIVSTEILELDRLVVAGLFASHPELLANLEGLFRRRLLRADTRQGDRTRGETALVIAAPSACDLLVQAFTNVHAAVPRPVLTVRVGTAPIPADVRYPDPDDLPPRLDDLLESGLPEPASAAATLAGTAISGHSGEVRWVKCPACAALVYSKRLQRTLKVCPECSYHFRLGAGERLGQLLDAGSFQDHSTGVESHDVLGFSDSKPYLTRLAEARRKTGRSEGAVYGPATLGGHPLVVAAMDFGFMGGSMGAAVGEIITRAAELAVDRRLPLLIVSASGGARMQEGCLSLMQMAKTSQALARLHEAGLLCVCLNTDPTFGGVTASFAMLGDILIAEPRSLVGFAGPSVIQQTIRQRLPEGFQTAEFLSDHGMLDLVEPRENLRQVLSKILTIHAAADGPLPSAEGRPPLTSWSDLATRPAWEVVTAARDVNRPTTLEYAGYLFDHMLELHGDRLYGENPPIVGGLAVLGEMAVVFIGHQKGHTTNEMIQRNFGMPDPEG